jgi:hypothetical protein
MNLEPKYAINDLSDKFCIHFCFMETDCMKQISVFSQPDNEVNGKKP